MNNTVCYNARFTVGSVVYASGDDIRGAAAFVEPQMRREGAPDVSTAIALNYGLSLPVAQVLDVTRVDFCWPSGLGKKPLSPSPSLLSERETEVLRTVAKGLSFAAIAEVLGISPHTVVTHVKKIYRKLSVHSRGEAVFEASQLGLL
jgi:DNA-binding CsgD family transcriptional regulator